MSDNMSENYDDIYGWDRYMLKNFIIRYMNTKAAFYDEKHKYSSEI